MNMRFLLLLFSIFVFSAYSQKTLIIGEKRFETGIQETIPTRIVSEDTNGVTVTYEFDKAMVLSDPLFPNCSFISIDGFGINAQARQYSFIERLDNLSIPAGSTVSVELLDYEYEDLAISLSPSRPALLGTDTLPDRPEDVPHPLSYTSFYPDKVVEMYRNNANIAQVLLRPMQYNCETQILRIPKKVKYRLNWTHSSRSREIKNCVINNTVLNPVKTSIINAGNESEGYIIIAASKYADAVHRFIEWKKLLGFEVVSSFSDSWNNKTVKSEILKLSQQLQNPQFLLLFGDNDDIPGIRKFRNNGDGYVTDYYYGFLTSDTLRLPDLFRGRIPVNTLDEANRVVDKIINYEKNPVILPDFYKNGIQASFFEDEKPDGGDGKADNRMAETSEDIKTYLEGLGKSIKRVYCATEGCSPQYWNDDLFSFGEPLSGDLKKPTFEWDGSATDVNEAINNGSFYLMHIGHAICDGWWVPRYNISDLSQLSNNRKTPVVFNINCRSGRFEDNCFAENFLKMKGGCIATISATIESYTLPDDGLACGIVDAIWPVPGLIPNFKYGKEPSTIVTSPIYRVGEVLDQGLIRMDETFPGYSVYQREVFHCLGDPTMMITTELPTCFDNVSIKRSENNVSVLIQNDDARISFYDKCTGEQKSVHSTSASFDCSNPNNVSIVISSHNKIPYIDYRANGETLYIQNEEINGRRFYQADKIVVGNNVCPNIPSGEVSFSSGIITLTAKEIVFEKGVRIEQGVELKTKTAK